MIISHQWLSEWVAVPSDINRLSDLLTMAGLEVGGVESVAAVSKRVVVGEVIDSIPQKDRPQLKICRVDTGHARVRNIVCGAANVQAGIKVAVALPGAKLASGPVRAQRFGDVLSNGMLCSSAELGLDDDSDGVLVLDNDAETGRGLNDHLELGDVLLDIELTPNRGDCLSVVGVAREVAAITGAGLMPPVLRNIRSIHDHRIPIKLEAPKDCPRWIGRVITGLRPATRTPDRIRERLRRSGIRSIDCVVDITNYVMIEYGQPMHAFRLDRIDSEIRVRHARRNERLTLLDGKKITMDRTTLVIADKNKSVALAGIMGGLKTAITADTRNVLLEAAYFRPQAVAQRARQMALQTDAVYRFERGVDPALQRTAMIRATALLCEATGAAPGPLCQAVVPGYLPQRRWIRLRRSRLDLMLGTRLPTAQISQVLNRLAMEVKRNGHDWLVRAPSYRLDISYEHDLIEEVARITNYENLPTHLPTARAPRGISRESSLSVSVIQDFLVARDYQEVITYSFVDSRREALISPSTRALRLKNPIADNMDVMRTSLWPGLLEAVLANMRRQERRIRIFEIGRVFQSNRKGVSERRCIGGCITGPVSGDQWDRERNKVDFFDLKGDIEALLSLTALPHKGINWRGLSDDPALHPRESAIVQYSKKQIGKVGRLHPDLADDYGFEQTIFLFELDLDGLLLREIPHYNSVSRFPTSSRDLSVVVPENVSAVAVAQEIYRAGGDLLRHLELFDVYRGNRIESTKKSLSYALTLQSTSRNLTDTEIDGQIEQIVEAIQSTLGGTLRGQ